MVQFPKKLLEKLEQRKVEHALRSLQKPSNNIDFSSNDYLGFAKSATIFEETHQLLKSNHLIANGSTGSRLLSGNSDLYGEVEKDLCRFHQSEAALIFNSGYNANLGFFGTIPQRGDIILYDELIHASIRDGIQLSNAKSYKFKHNDLDDLNEILKRFQDDKIQIYVVTEAVFSMDGDTPDLIAMANLCEKYLAHFVVDEAHSLGVFGKQGCGKIQALGLQNNIFARIVTFGKALGCHGAAILGSADLKNYLVNFSRSFIYTTALPPHALASIKVAYEHLKLSPRAESRGLKLLENIQFFTSEIQRLQLESLFIKSSSAIHCCMISNAKKTQQIAKNLQANGFDVKPILSPTVSKSQERLRFCLHRYNSKEEITEVLELLCIFVQGFENPRKGLEPFRG